MHKKLKSVMHPSLAQAVADAEGAYRERNPMSCAAAERALDVMPGGNTRSSLWTTPFPLCMTGGEGAQLTDADGHSYIDFLGEFTSGIFGHSPALLRTALITAFDSGINLSSHNLVEADLAAEICRRFASIERVRFTNSGTEANIMAITAARAFTKRTKIMVFSHCYHGTGMTFQNDIPPTALPFDFIIVPYNDLARASAVAQENASTLAAILVEPMLGAGGCVPADPNFLSGLQEIAQRHGALLILDEVQTARLAVGGRQQLLGLKPDLTTMGKFFGGGLAFGCFGGRQDVMAMFDPRMPGAVAHSGTFNNNVLAMSTGLVATRDLLTVEALATLNARGDRLRDGLTALFEKRAAPFRVTGLGSLMNIHPEGSVEVVGAMRKLLYLDLIEDGIYIAQRGLIALCLPLCDSDTSLMIDRVDAYLDRRLELI